MILHRKRGVKIMVHKDKSDSARELQRQYLKAWRAKNKDKVRKYNEAYWERKAEAERRRAENEQAEN